MAASWTATLKGARIPLIILLVVFGIYFLTNSTPLQWYKHYVYQAEAFLEGRANLEGYPDYYQDLVTYEGKQYLASPPMPAVLLLPAVAVFGEDTNQVRISMAIGAANVALAYILLRRLKVHGLKLWMLTALFGLGTVHWEVATRGTTWFYAEIVAVFFLLLSLIELFGKKRVLLIGLLLGCAALARLPVVMAAIFFLALLVKDEGFPRKPVLFLSALAVPIALLAYFNFVRFGSPIETGYLQHSYAAYFAADIEKYGFFNIHYLPKHLYTILLMPPEYLDRWPFLRPMPDGMSIFLTTPAVFYAFKAGCSERMHYWAGAAIIAILLPTVLWFSTGWVQFGYRYSLDFMPLLLILICAGMGKRVTKGMVGVVALCIAVNLWGALWSVKLGW